MYLQRVLRPIWDVKVCYKSSNGDFRPTFGQNIVLVQSKLRDLLAFITRHKQSLFGQVFEPKDKFVRNQLLLSMVTPVYEMSGAHKQNLEIMEKNSLKNLDLFITRCI